MSDRRKRILSRGSRRYRIFADDLLARRMVTIFRKYGCRHLSLPCFKFRREIRGGSQGQQTGGLDRSLAVNMFIDVAFENSADSFPGMVPFLSLDSWILISRQNKCDLLKRKLKRGVIVKTYMPSYGSRPNEVVSVVKCVQIQFCPAQEQS